MPSTKTQVAIRYLNVTVGIIGEELIICLYSPQAESNFSLRRGEAIFL